MKETLKNEGWLYDEAEDRCEAYVKGIYDLWIYPQNNNRIVIESEEFGVEVDLHIINKSHLLELIKPFKNL
jgi:hypothetical protein